MTRILLISPSREIVVHDIPIFENSDVKKVQAFIKNKEEDYGEIIRFACMMSKESAFPVGEEDVNTLIAKEGIGHVTLHRALLVDKQAGAAIEGAGDFIRR